MPSAICGKCCPELLHHAGRDGLGPRVDQAEGAQRIGNIADAARIQRNQDILKPWEQQESDGNALLMDDAEKGGNSKALEQHCPGSYQQVGHPMKLGAHMVQRGDTQKAVAVHLPMVVPLPFTGGSEGGVTVDHRLGNAGSTRRKVDGGVFHRLQGREVRLVFRLGLPYVLDRKGKGRTVLPTPHIQKRAQTQSPR